MDFLQKIVAFLKLVCYNAVKSFYRMVIMNIGELINKRRTELELTLEDVGNAVGVSKSTVKKWEDGFISNMKRDKISALAKVLKLNPVSLITGETSDEETERNSLNEQLTGIDFALQSETKELTDEQKQSVLDYVKFLKSQK